MNGTTALAAGKRQPTSTRLLLWTLLIVYIFNFLDRQIANILAEPIAKELGLSDTQLGLLTGLAFALFYTVLGIPLARWADRPGNDRVRLIAVSLTLWSAMTALCGMAQNFTQLLLARIGVGVGEAGCTPAAHSLITDAVPPEKRSSAMAFYGLGIPIGGLLGLVIGGVLADWLGWRAAFVAVGLPGVLLAAFVWFGLVDPRRTGHAPVHAGEMLGVGAALKLLFASPAYLLILAATSTVAFLGYGKHVWAVIFFQRTHGLTPGETGLFYGLTVGLAGILGTWLGGWLADRYGKRDKRHILTAPAIGGLVAAPLLFLAYSAADWRLALALLIVPTILNSFYYGPAFSAAHGIVAPRSRAMASAMLIFGQNLIGLGLGPLFFGMLSDAFKAEAGAESVRWVLFGAAWLGIIPGVLFWLASRRLAREMA